MFTALFILSVVMFGYMMYVLIKPEEFLIGALLLSET